MNRSFYQRKNRSFALVVTLLMVAALTVLIVGFLATVQIEKLNSRSYLNIYKAQLAAQSGLQAALNQFSANPGVKDFHYISYMKTDPIGTTNLCIVPMTAGSSTLGTPIIVGTALSATNCGIAPSPDQPDVTNQVGYAQLLDINNQEVGRYAYCADDEGGKQNINRCGGIPYEDYATNLSEIPLFQPDTNAFPAAAMSAIQAAHGPSYVKANAQAIPTAQTLNVIVPGLNPTADVNNYTTESLSSYLTPEGYPKLNLTDLKRLLDSNIHVFPVESGTDFSSLTQGITNPRCVLVKELLNEDGGHDYTSQNPWGYGSLQYLKRRYVNSLNPADLTPARQVVANILNYIDASHIPITDGAPATLAGPGKAGSASVQPTFLGVKAWVNGKTIQGHPYITYVGQGYDIGQTLSAPSNYKESLLATVGMVNPWSSPTLNLSGYTPSITATVVCTTGSFTPGGSLTAPAPINAVMPAFSAVLYPGTGANDDYVAVFHSGQTPTTAALNFSGTLTATDCSLLYNGYIVQSIATALSNPVNPPLLNYKYNSAWRTSKDSTSNFITQILTFTTQALIGSSIWSYPPSQFVPTWPYSDWHLVTDPRINFLKTDNFGHYSWMGLSTINSNPLTVGGLNQPGIPATPPSDPLVLPSVFANMSAAEGDGRQGTSYAPNTWWNAPGPVNHFPTYAQGYHPSPAVGQPAMTSLGELGFIHTGRPWQTLHIQPDMVGDPNEDYKLLDYVKVGDISNYPETVSNSLTDRANPPASSTFVFPGVVGRVDGLVNINTANGPTLTALYTRLTSTLSGSSTTWTSTEVNDPVNGLVNATLTSPKRPFASVSALYSDPEFGTIISNNPSITTDSGKEDLMRRISNAITVQSQNFTIYVVGESRFQGKDGTTRTQGRVVLRAAVKLMESKAADGSLTIKPVVVSSSYL